ncbi:hypothetical protein LJC06_00410 [Bacteroidales bacterium OttesenSCG-928-I14]|nr:hypothetical protein [Bacteroidales bacterium OttesenSCG-928-I14]
MEANEISFENLPKVVAHLVSELAEIKSLVEKGQVTIVPQKRIPIDIEEACRIIGKAKPTVYALVRNLGSDMQPNVQTYGQSNSQPLNRLSN